MLYDVDNKMRVGNLCFRKKKYTEKIGCCDARGEQFITGHENWSAAVNNFTDNFIYQQVGYKHNREENTVGSVRNNYENYPGSSKKYFR